MSCFNARRMLHLVADQTMMTVRKKLFFSSPTGKKIMILNSIVICEQRRLEIVKEIMHMSKAF